MSDSQKPRNIDLGGPEFLSANYQITYLRGQAINAYAVLEQSLCNLLRDLGDMSIQTAGVIFFRMPNRYRLDTLRKLKKRKLGAEYATFWNTALKRIGELDQQRNEIVHWHIITIIGGTDITAALAPPNFWDTTNETPQITTDELTFFIQKADFVSRALNMFSLHLLKSEALTDSQTWLDIFQQELVYPPLQDTHPLSWTATEPDNPPPASRG